MLYEWFSTQACNYPRDGAEGRYGRLLAATGAQLHTFDVQEELLADFTGAVG